MRRILLLSGPIAVGKTAVRDVLVHDYGFEALRSSGYLRTIAAERGLKDERASLQELGDELDRSTDFRWIVERVALPAMLANEHQDYWLIDAVRKEQQIKHFRSACADQGAVFHVHLMAPEAIIRDRYNARCSPGDSSTYEFACDHDNERSARALVSTADFVCDTQNLSAAQCADRVIAEWARRNVA